METKSKNAEMIDTLKLNLNDCEISPGTPLIIEQPSIQHDTGELIHNNDLFVDSKGEIVTGKKAYYNSKYFNLTILAKQNVETSPAKTQSTYGVTKKDFSKAKQAGKIIGYEKITHTGKFEPEKFNSKIFVQFSFPRFNNTNNFKPITRQQQKDVLFDLEDQLRSIGVKTNIFQSDISRLDTFININAENSFSHYTPVFELMNAARKKAMTWNGETYLWKSGEHQIEVYDKIREMTSKISDEKQLKLFSDLNIVRIENRFTTKRKFFSKFGFSKLNYLYSDYGEIKKVFNQDISKSIFKYEKNDIELLTGESIKQELQNFKDNGGRYWMRKFLVYTGYLSLIRLSSLDTVLKAIEELEIDGSRSRQRVIKHRIKKTFEDAKAGYELSKSSYFQSLKTYKELYNELKQKFLKQVA